MARQVIQRGNAPNDHANAESQYSAFGKINNPVVRLGLFKAVSKTSVQCVLYPLLFAWAGFKGWTGVRPVPRAV